MGFGFGLQVVHPFSGTARNVARLDPFFKFYNFQLQNVVVDFVGQRFGLGEEFQGL